MEWHASHDHHTWRTHACPRLCTQLHATTAFLFWILIVAPCCCAVVVSGGELRQSWVVGCLNSVEWIVVQVKSWLVGHQLERLEGALEDSLKEVVSHTQDCSSLPHNL